MTPKQAAPTSAERLDVVVIGAGQAGLAAGYHLAKRGLRFAIVDGARRVGDSWRHRWDSLRLFTPARYDGLPGLPFPAPGHAFPTKDELADYLESYARRFALPVRLETRVERVHRVGRRYCVHTSTGTIEAAHVIVAMAQYQTPRIPDFARALRTDIRQIHSSAYRKPSQLTEGPVLVVGAGNSGAEIALELAKDGKRPVYLAGRDTGHVPFAVDGLAARLLLSWLVLRVMFHHVLKVTTPMGRRAKEAQGGKGALLIRTKPRDLIDAGVRRVPRIESIVDGLPALENGERLDVTSVVWSTGFEPGFAWIDRPVFGPQGEPLHDKGIARDEPGLYFIGLHFLYSMSSSMLHGVGRDAERIVDTITARRTQGYQ